jgi:hypothetical protein
VAGGTIRNSWIRWVRRFFWRRHTGFRRTARKGRHKVIHQLTLYLQNNKNVSKKIKYMKKQSIILLTAALLCTVHASAADYLLEAESFTHKGGRVVNRQFMDQMGSPYLMAHGMGAPIADAGTQITLPVAGMAASLCKSLILKSPSNRQFPDGVRSIFGHSSLKSQNSKIQDFPAAISCTQMCPSVKNEFPAKKNTKKILFI